jgi:Flp pilus assembly protein TadB
VKRSRPDQVHSITGVRPSQSDDLNARVTRYLISMGIRTVCVVLAIVVPSPWRWIFAVGAVGLPYVAVVFANAGRSRGEPAPAAPVPRARSALPPETAPPERPAQG